MRVEFDRADQLLLQALQEDARSSYKELAARTGLAPSSCLARVRSLRARGVISGFRAELDLRQLGRTLEALIAIRLRAPARALQEPFERSLLALPETLALFSLAGPDDYLLHVALAEPEQLRAFVRDRLSGRSEIAQLQTSLVYAHRRTPVVLPLGDKRS